MRTDAVNLSKDAISNCREVIQKYFGDDYLPKAPKEYKTKSKNAQEAHEAIRPSDLMNTPKKLENTLDSDAHKLYELIWKRTVACQMNPAVLDKVVIDSTSKDGKIILRANGQVIAFDGFLKLYVESKDDNDEDEENRILPNVDKGEYVNKGDIKTEQHWTQPPPRFTEASLVKRLEELGIGRPSTYASIIAVLQDRKYVRVEKLRFIPEDRGRIVTVFLENYFKKYVEYDFTAQLEEFLDDVSNGEMDWKKLLTGFWVKFIANVKAVEPLKVSDVIDKIEEVLEYHLFPPREDGSDPRECPECHNGKLNVKLGKFGAFLGCSNYPECKYTKPLIDTTDEESRDPSKDANQEDKVMGELNGMKIYLKKGPFGYYVQLGEDATATTEKPKRSSLPKSISPDELTPEQALTLISLPKDLGNGIEVNIGKFGQYIKQGGKSKSLTGNDNIFNITLERAEEILKNVAERPQGKVLGQYKKNDIQLLSGRYGPYLKVGKNNYALPKEFKDKEPALEDAIKIIEAKK
jgi:DNA topoisomerase-1